MRLSLCLIVLVVTFFGCKKDGDDIITPPDTTMYFPPIGTSEWATTSPASLGWNEDAIQPLLDYLAEKNTKSFMILVNGRIVIESYFDGHNAAAEWQWNSAGKTLVSATTGIAQQEGLLNINNKVSEYLGNGWTSAPLEKENLITSRNLLTMTSGLNDSSELVIKYNLTYVADAGTRWSYHNVFQKLMDVIAEAGDTEFETYFDSHLKNKIGMDGYWEEGIIFTIYHSNSRSMARFGLLALNNGKWDTEEIIDPTYFTECINTSQELNPSYGYLWWLNGKPSAMLPGGQEVYTGPLIPNAPTNMYAAMGAEDQRIYVIPETNMVIVRMGNASDPLNPSFALSGFDNELWGKINDVIN